MIAMLHDMIGPLLRRSRRRWGLAASLAGAGTLLAACHLLDVSNPDIVPPGGLNNAAALPTIRAGAIGDLHIAYTGSVAQGSGGTTEGVLRPGARRGLRAGDGEGSGDGWYVAARLDTGEPGEHDQPGAGGHRSCARRCGESGSGRHRGHGGRNIVRISDPA